MRHPVLILATLIIHSESLQSHSTTAILTEDNDDQTPPIVPNKSPATPDVWVARTIKA